MLDRPDSHQDTFGLQLSRLIEAAIDRNETVYIRTTFDEHYRLKGKPMIGRDSISFVSNTASSEILLPYTAIAEVNRYPAES